MSHMVRSMSATHSAQVTTGPPACQEEGATATTREQPAFASRQEERVSPKSHAADAPNR